MPYLEVGLYQRMSATAEAVRNTDSPEKDWLSINCFAVGVQSFLNADNLEQEANSDIFYSRVFEDTHSSDAKELQRDYPLLLVQPPTTTTPDLHSGPYIYNFRAYLLDKYKVDRDGGNDGTAAARQREQIWEDCTKLANQFLQTLEDRPTVMIPKDSFEVIERRKEGDHNGNLCGIEFTFRVRLVVDICDYTFEDPCPECSDDPVTINNTAGTTITSADAGSTYVVADSNVSNSDDSFSQDVAATVDLELSDVTVSNSDDSYSADFPAATDIDLPSVTHTDSDGSSVPTPGMKPFVASACANAAVSNSDDSYSQSVASGGSLELPDVDIESSAGNYTNTHPSASPSAFVIPDVSWTDSDGSSETTEYGQPITCTVDNELEIEIRFDADIDTTDYDNDTGYDWTLSSHVVTDSGTVTYEVDAVSESFPITVANGETLTINRSTSTSAGKVVISGTHNDT